MKYSIYITRDDEEPLFLQASNDLARLTSCNSVSVTRWVNEMSADPDLFHSNNSSLTVLEDGELILQRDNAFRSGRWISNQPKETT